MKLHNMKKILLLDCLYAFNAAKIASLVVINFCSFPHHKTSLYDNFCNIFIKKNSLQIFDVLLLSKNYSHLGFSDFLWLYVGIKVTTQRVYFLISSTVNWLIWHCWFFYFTISFLSLSFSKKNNRVEYLWPFWLLLRSVYDSYKYKGLVRIN